MHEAQGPPPLVLLTLPVKNREQTLIFFKHKLVQYFNMILTEKRASKLLHRDHYNRFSLDRLKHNPNFNDIDGQKIKVKELLGTKKFR